MYTCLNSSSIQCFNVSSTKIRHYLLLVKNRVKNIRVDFQIFSFIVLLLIKMSN